MKKIVLTYGTFDLFHVGHLNLLERLRDLGDFLIVGVSTDEFNKIKGKKSVVSFHDRSRIISALKCVNLVIPEQSWNQKVADIKKHGVHIFGIGDDWQGKFDDLRDFCQVVYLPRTEGISTTLIRQTLRMFRKTQINDLKKALDLICDIVERFD